MTTTEQIDLGKPSPLDSEMEQRAAALRVAREVLPTRAPVMGVALPMSPAALLAVADWIMTGLTQLDRERYDTRTTEPDAVRYEPADMLRALIHQIANSQYWRDRARDGVHHPTEIITWLESLIDAGWAPSLTGSRVEASIRTPDAD